MNDDHIYLCGKQAGPVEIDLPECDGCATCEEPTRDTEWGVYLCRDCRREAREFLYYLKDCPEGSAPATHLPERIVKLLLEDGGRDQDANFDRSGNL